jgi:transposase
MKNTAGKEPRKLTEAVEKRLCEAIALGCSKTIAARLAGIDRATLWRWTEQGEADLDQEKDSVYCNLCNGLKKAEAAFQAYALTVIHDAAPQNWQAAAWLLERKRPEEWGRRDRVQTTEQMEQLKLEAGKEILAEMSAELSQLKPAARRMLMAAIPRST